MAEDVDLAFFLLMNDRDQPVMVVGSDGSRALAVFTTHVLAERTRLEFGYDARIAEVTRDGADWWIDTCRRNGCEWVTVDWFGQSDPEVFRPELLRDLPRPIEGESGGG